MSEREDKARDRKAPDDDEAPEVIAHEGEEEPWCVSYACGALAPD
jgi:hypothetical protein